ncbi:hypothetical protein QYE76_017935 [Lolium multiflorum]|uniref:F-box domain-containing protein n=1 Tax=Lolium multiflorum TaxID=4521 RepID=A0AAD8PRK4_LOLMU|nr:hypothetical protein QYE76_017935 [Lolium multiflorum]
MGQCPSAPRRHHHRKPSPPPSPAAQPPSPRFSDVAASDDAAPEPDYTAELPEELLAAVFGLLGSGERKRCSLVSRRWLAAEAASRLRLALDARDPLLPAAPGILRRFSAVSKLALKCDRRANSVGDPALVLVARRLGPGLRRLKLRSLRAVTDDGVHAPSAVNLRRRRQPPQALRRLLRLRRPRHRGGPPLLHPARGALRQAPPGPRQLGPHHRPRPWPPNNPRPWGHVRVCRAASCEPAWSPCREF